jgi:glyoxylase I family protein
MEDVVAYKGEHIVAGHNEKIGGGGFHHVAMRVRDFDASIKFYTEGLGFKVRLAWGPEDRRVVLLDTGDGNYLEILGGGSTEFNPVGVIGHLAFRTDDIEKATAAARAAGAEITVEPGGVTLSSDPPTPIQRAFFTGPDGELIEFFQDETT